MDWFLKRMECHCVIGNDLQSGQEYCQAMIGKEPTVIFWPHQPRPPLRELTGQNVILAGCWTNKDLRGVLDWIMNGRHHGLLSMWILSGRHKLNSQIRSQIDYVHSFNYSSRSIGIRAAEMPEAM